MTGYYNLVMNYCNSLIDHGSAKNWKDLISINNIIQININHYCNPDKFPCMFGYDRAILKTQCRHNTELTGNNSDPISQ